MRRHVRAIPAAIVLTVWGGHVAVAQPTTDVSALVDQLDAATLEARERATQSLSELELTFDALRRAGVDFETLKAEQRSRLDHILLEQFRRTPRAGLGVQFDQNFVQGGVRLAAVVDEFPASTVLQGGDVVARVEGIDLGAYVSREGWQTLRHQILSFHPGESMDVMVRRAGRTMRVQVPLGSYVDLVNAQPLTESDYAAAWSVRRNRLGVDMRTADRVGAPRVAGAWTPMTPLDRSRYEPSLDVIAGGSPGARPTVALERIAQDARRVNSNSRIIVGRQNDPRVRVRPVQPNAPLQGAEAQRALLLQQIVQWEANRNNARQKAADPSLPEPQRSFWAEQLQNAELQLAALLEAMRELDDDQ